MTEFTLSATQQLQTKRLSLAPFSKNHISLAYIQWLNDPKVVRFSELRHRVHSIESSQHYLASFIDSPHYFWAIQLNEPPHLHIGNITAHVDPHNQIAEIGILIGEVTVWGQGYGLEAWQAVCNFLLKEIKIRKISAGTLSENTSMLSIMKRAGMKEDGVRRNHYVVEGKCVDMVHYCIFNNII